MSENKTLFPEIGKVVDETAKHPEPEEEKPTGDEDDERPVQEVESLCMKCYQQVSALVT